MERLKSLTLMIFLPSLVALTGCEDLVQHDTERLLDPNPLGRGAFSYPKWIHRTLHAKAAFVIAISPASRVILDGTLGKGLVYGETCNLRNRHSNAESRLLPGASARG
jgi:hypothetical protein